MSVFADSSALVKLYVDESGDAVIRGLDALIVAQLARVEVPAALWRKRRLGELSPEAAGTLTADFEADYFGTVDEPPRFAPVQMSVQLLDEAARMCASRGLRAYDGIQLSSALAARSADRNCTTFAAFDGELRAAAVAEGFALIPAA
ncbi:MAG: type II toxin-antitoxin system VapC family toxin [Acidimicrobiales bacterium]